MSTNSAGAEGKRKTRPDAPPVSSAGVGKSLRHLDRMQPTPQCTENRSGKILKILGIHPESSRNCFGFIIQNIIFFLSVNAICCSGARDAVIITILGRALPDAINRCCAVIHHFTSWAMCITSIRSGAKAVGENHLPRPGRFVIDLIQRHRFTRFCQGELIVLRVTGTICTSNYDIFALLRDVVAMIYAESNFRLIVVPIRHRQNIVALLRKRLSELVIIYRNTITGQRNSRNVGVSTTRGSRGLILFPIFYPVIWGASDSSLMTITVILA